MSKLVELRLEIDALSSTWVGYPEERWCKLSADLCCKAEADTSVVKLLLLLLSAACVVGAVVGVAGCCSTSKLGSCALSSSICCTIVLLEAAHAPPCLCRLEAGVEKLPLFFWLVCLFLFLLLFLLVCFLLQAAARSWELTLCRSLYLSILACLCKLCHISYLSWVHADHGSR